MEAEYLMFVENRKGAKLGMSGDFDDLRIKHNNMYISAMARTDCPKCYAQESDCSNLGGIMLAIIGSGGKTIPIDKGGPLALYNHCTDDSYDSKIYWNNGEFENWRTDYSNSAVEAWRKCKNNKMFWQDGASHDGSASHIFRNTHCKNCERSALIKFINESPSKLGWRGGCGSFLCTGKKNILMTDLDGKLFGAPS